VFVMRIEEIMLGVAVVGVLLGAALDARTGHIPNWITIPPLVVAPLAAFGFRAAADGPRAGVHAALISLLGAFVCALGPFVMFARGGLGGGDVKLLAAVGALLGPRLGIDAEFYGFVIGALYIPAKLAWHGRLFATLAAAGRVALNPLRKKDTPRAAMPDSLRMRIRLGPALCAGTLFAILLARIGS
jgi:prepilin peptidase CpaA